LKYLLCQQSRLQRLLIYVLMLGIQSGLGSGITGGVYSGTGVTDDGTEKLIPLILLQPVLEHIQ
jgi:hypothetical protein